MILFYYSIGTVLEKTWGTFQYNLYIFSGLIFTIIGAFLSYLYSYIRFGGISVSVISATLSLVVTTYYVNMSIFWHMRVHSRIIWSYLCLSYPLKLST